MVAVLVIHSTIDRAFRRGAQGYDLIVGAKGGQLPLVWVGEKWALERCHPDSGFVPDASASPALLSPEGAK